MKFCDWSWASNKTVTPGPLGISVSVGNSRVEDFGSVLWNLPGQQMAPRSFPTQRILVACIFGLHADFHPHFVAIEDSQHCQGSMTSLPPKVWHLGALPGWKAPAWWEATDLGLGLWEIPGWNWRGALHLQRVLLSAAIFRWGCRYLPLRVPSRVQLTDLLALSMSLTCST
jgi:hypothetical protein